MSVIDTELTISICTIGDRIFGALEVVKSGPKNAFYLIIHQRSRETKEVVEEKIRNLINVEQLNLKYQPINTIGVAHARNAAIELTNTKYLLFMDDDVSLTDSVFDALSNFSISDSDVATFICLNEKNEPRRKFSSIPFVHNRISLFGVGTVEIMIKVDSVRKHPCRFPVNMGAGQYLSLADEPVFLARCLDYGCKISFFPIPIVSHPSDSSGSELKTNGSLEARGLAVKEIFGPIFGAFVLLIFIIKSKGHFSRFKSIKGFLHSFFYMCNGFLRYSAK